MGDLASDTSLPSLSASRVADAQSAPRAYAWLATQLTRPYAVLRLSLLAFVLSLPAIATGLVTDDYQLEDSVIRDPWSAFIFRSLDPEVRRSEILAQRDAGTTPWWIDEQLHQAFLRPLSSLTHAVDFRLWPHAVFLMHIENSLLFAIAVWLAGAVYRELGLSPVVFGFATFFYAASGNLGTTVAWISGRNTLLAAVFGLLALWLHLQSERAVSVAQRTRLKVGAVVALGGGLLSAEFAAGVAGFLLADALILREGRLARRLLSLWPYAVLLGAWQVVYITNNYGATGSGFYHGPAQEPIAFSLRVITGPSIYLASQLTLPFATFSCFYAWGLAVVTLIALLILVLLRGLFIPLLRDDGRMRFLALGAALSTLPLAATDPQDRLVFFVAFGTAGLLSQLLADRFAATNPALSQRGARWLFRVHGVYLPALFLPMLFSTATANAVGGGARALANALPASGQRGVVLVNAPSELMYSQHLIRRREGRPALPYFALLYAGAQAVEVSRTSARSLELDVKAGYLAAPIERIFRNPIRSPFHPGDVVKLPQMQVTIRSVNAQGAPTRVGFAFPDVLERLAIDWLVWEGRTPRPWKPPPIGGRVEVAGVRAVL